MSAKKLFQLLCMGLLITMRLPMPRALSQISDEQRDIINGRLEEITSLLSIPLYDPDVRDLILEGTKASRVFEQKLDLDDIVTAARDLGSRTGTPSWVWEDIGTAIDGLRDTVEGDARDPNTPTSFYDL